MKKNESFEQSLLNLEESVRKLESGGLTLDESLKEFENAVKLIKKCNKKIEEARLKVRMLIETDDGSVTDAPFDVSDNET